MIFLIFSHTYLSFEALFHSTAIFPSVKWPWRPLFCLFRLVAAHLTALFSLQSGHIRSSSTATHSYGFSTIFFVLSAIPGPFLVTMVWIVSRNQFSETRAQPFHGFPSNLSDIPRFWVNLWIWVNLGLNRHKSPKFEKKFSFAQKVQIPSFWVQDLAKLEFFALFSHSFEFLTMFFAVLTYSIRSISIPHTLPHTHGCTSLHLLVLIVKNRSKIVFFLYSLFFLHLLLCLFLLQPCKFVLLSSSHIHCSHSWVFNWLPWHF